MIELSDIVGQDAAVARLERALAGRRRPHAYLFAGPAGVGRRTTAFALARALLCSSPASMDRPGWDGPFVQGCGACPDCKMQAADSHPDFHLIYKELAQYHDDSEVRKRVMQDLGIPVIRQFLIDPCGRSPARGKGRVFVVLEAELMSDAAQNALLKTLEEPPKGVTIILICRQAEQLLPTTLSRCSMVRFGPLPRSFVEGKLTGAGVEAVEAAFWAAYTEGSVGRALRLAKEGFYLVKRDIVGQLAGMGPAGDAGLGERLAGATDRLATAAVDAAKEGDDSNLAKTLASRRAAGAMLELIASVYRDAMNLATGAGAPLIHADQADAVRAIAGRFPPGQLAEIIAQLSRYERLLWRNVNPKVVWDNAAITFATAAPLRV